MKKKTPVELNSLAAFIVDQATNEEPQPEDNSSKNPAAVALGKLGGLKGGKRRAEILSVERRREIAVLAARSRWKTHREANDEKKED